MGQEEPAKAPTPEAKPERPPIPPERRLYIQCGTCGWNAWVEVPTPVRELHFDIEDTTGEVRSMPIKLIVCAACGTRLYLNRGEDGKLAPSFDLPRAPLYKDALSGRVTVNER